MSTTRYWRAYTDLSQPLIVVEVVMGYYMVHWGAGVHQWQVTLEQLFHQLYVCSPSQRLPQLRLTAILSGPILPK
jgi:hypothetical protein